MAIDESTKTLEKTDVSEKKSEGVTALQADVNATSPEDQKKYALAESERILNSTKDYLPTMVLSGFEDETAGAKDEPVGFNDDHIGYYNSLDSMPPGSEGHDDPDGSKYGRVDYEYVAPKEDEPSDKDVARDTENAELTTYEKYDQLDEQRNKYDQAIESKVKDPAQRARMRDDAEKFLQREDEMTDMYRKQYEKQGMSSDEAEDMGRKRAIDEMKDTMKESTRLLEAEGNQPITPEKRQMLAEQVMHHAADPTTVEQGQYNTCQSAAMESRMYRRDPSAAAKLVADVGTTGEYTAADGKHVKLHPDNMAFDNESANWPSKGGGDRSYANQIFQNTAVNLRYQETDPNCEYRMKPGGGERLIDVSKGTDGVDEDGTPWEFRGFPTEQVATNYNRISGRTEYGVGITAPPFSVEPEHATAIESEEKLDTTLAQMKEEGKLPTVVWVHTGNEPFLTDSGHGAAGGSGGGHYVTVTDYEPAKDGKPSRVEIDNQWGESNDHQWKSQADKDKAVTTSQLWQSMHSPA